MNINNIQTAIVNLVEYTAEEIGQAINIQAHRQASRYSCPDVYKTETPLHRHNYEYLQGIFGFLPTKREQEFEIALPINDAGEIGMAGGEILFRGASDKWGVMLTPVGIAGVTLPASAWVLAPARSVMIPSYTVAPITISSFRIIN